MNTKTYDFTAQRVVQLLNLAKAACSSSGLVSGNDKAELLALLEKLKCEECMRLLEKADVKYPVTVGPPPKVVKK